MSHWSDSKFISHWSDRKFIGYWSDIKFISYWSNSMFMCYWSNSKFISYESDSQFSSYWSDGKFISCWFPEKTHKASLRPSRCASRETDISAGRVHVWFSFSCQGEYPSWRQILHQKPGTLVTKKFLDNGAYHSQLRRADEINIMNNLWMESVELEIFFPIYCMCYCIYHCVIVRFPLHTRCYDKARVWWTTRG